MPYLFVGDSGANWDLDDAGAPVLRVLDFYFRRILADETITPDSYWPSNRSCRDECLNCTCWPPVPFPKIVFLRLSPLDGSSNIFPGAYSAAPKSGETEEVDRAPDAATQRLDLGGGLELQLEFAFHADPTGMERNVLEWQEPSFAGVVTIRLQGSPGSSYQLVFATEEQIAIGGLVPKGELQPSLYTVVSGINKQFDSEERLVLVEYPDECPNAITPLCDQTPSGSELESLPPITIAELGRYLSMFNDSADTQGVEWCFDGHEGPVSQPDTGFYREVCTPGDLPDGTVLNFNMVWRSIWWLRRTDPASPFPDLAYRYEQHLAWGDIGIFALNPLVIVPEPTLDLRSLQMVWRPSNTQNILVLDETEEQQTLRFRVILGEIDGENRHCQFRLDSFGIFTINANYNDLLLTALGAQFAFSLHLWGRIIEVVEYGPQFGSNAATYPFQDGVPQYTIGLRAGNPTAWYDAQQLP